MKLDIHKRAEEYWRDGWTALTTIDLVLASKLQRRIMSRWDDLATLRDGESSGGGHSLYYVIDGLAVENHFAELVGLYHGLLPLLRHVTGQDLLLSPWPRSAVNIKLYLGQPSEQGWHVDSNPVTALLYLTDLGNTLEFSKPDGDTWKIRPQTGKLVLMRGKEFRHRVAPRTRSQTGVRISVPMNYYTPDDRSRPDWLDSVIYGNMPVPDSGGSG